MAAATSDDDGAGDCDRLPIKSGRFVRAASRAFIRAASRSCRAPSLLEGVITKTSASAFNTRCTAPGSRSGEVLGSLAGEGACGHLSLFCLCKRVREKIYHWNALMWLLAGTGERTFESTRAPGCRGSEMPLHGRLAHAGRLVPGAVPAPDGFRLGAAMASEARAAERQPQSRTAAAVCAE